MEENERDRRYPGWLTKELAVYICAFREIASATRISTEDRMRRLNDYLAASVEVILANGGEIVKYIGQSILCCWNANEKQEDHAMRACRCALQQYAKIQSINSKLTADRKMTIHIGISSGPCTVGNFGSEKELHYDIFGDSVNLACELVGDNFKDCSILLNDDTYNRIRNIFAVTRLGNFQIKGQEYSIGLYELRVM